MGKAKARGDRSRKPFRGSTQNQVHFWEVRLTRFLASDLVLSCKSLAFAKSVWSWVEHWVAVKPQRFCFKNWGCRWPVGSSAQQKSGAVELQPSGFLRGVSAHCIV